MRHALILSMVTFVALQAWQTRQYVPVFRSDLTLWFYAAQHAPRKPRPWVNLGLALLREGRYDDAKRALRRAQVLALLPTTPAWDREDALNVATHDLNTITILEVFRK